MRLRYCDRNAHALRQKRAAPSALAICCGTLRLIRLRSISVTPLIISNVMSQNAVPFAFCRSDAAALCDTGLTPLIGSCVI